MRVLIVNTSERTGGAALAAHRLMDALNNCGVKAKMLVRDKETDNITVAVHMNRLREKLEDDPAHPKLLQTVWGVGYRLAV